MFNELGFGHVLWDLNDLESINKETGHLIEIKNESTHCAINLCVLQVIFRLLDRRYSFRSSPTELTLR